jgi:hypothetical protein
VASHGFTGKTRLLKARVCIHVIWPDDAIVTAHNLMGWVHNGMVGAAIVIVGAAMRLSWLTMLLLRLRIALL